MPRLLTLLAIAVAAPGCYLGHGGAGESVPVTEDAGATPPSRPTPTAPDPRPTPSTCPLARGEVACVGAADVEPGRPFVLPVRLSHCGCGGETQCDVSVDRASRVVALETAFCDRPLDCDECSPVEISCDVPALEAGSYRVFDNGAYAFELSVVADEGLIPQTSMCADFAAAPECGPVAVPGMRFGADEVAVSCLDVSRLTGPALRIRHECWPCGSVPGECRVTYEERLTDDLPQGGEFHLSAAREFTNCLGTCPDECTPRDVTCTLPHFSRDEFYRVWMDGDVVFEFNTADPSASSVECGDDD